MKAAVCLGFFPNRHAQRDANFGDFVSTWDFQKFAPPTKVQNTGSHARERGPWHA